MFQDRVRGTGRLRRMLAWIAEPSRQLEQLRGIETFSFPGTYQLLKLTPRLPRVIHCHNLHGGYFDLRVLPSLSHQVPVILTLHDAWLLSGHCAYPFDCERWRTGCGHCPDLTISPAIRRDATAYNWRRKRDIYTRSRLYITTPSDWLMKKVQQSMLQGVAYRVIPNGVNLNIFHPGDKQEARASLDLPGDAWVLLFVSNTIKRNIWKDYATLEIAVRTIATNYDLGLQIGNRKVILLCLGESGETQRIGRVEVRFVPHQKDAEVVARFYQAADVYLHAARVENSSLAVTEALACGTPVVATAVGAIPEVVENGRTGFLVPPGDAAAMAQRIVQLLTDDAMHYAFSREATESAQHCFDLNRQVDEYLAWYAELVNARPNSYQK